MKVAVFAVALAVATSLGVAHAQSGMKGMDMKGMDMKDKHGAADEVHKASGKVTKVDAAKGSVTIAHGPVPSINWPSMTMSFKVKDKAMVRKVKSGDQVEFSFSKSGRDYVITEMK